MDRRDRLLGAVLGAIHFTFHVFMRLVPPLIPVLAVELAFPLWKLGLLVSAYFAGSSIGLLPMGMLSDAYDRRLLLSAALGVVGAGYVLFAFAPALGAGLPAVAAFGTPLGGPFAVMLLAMLVSGLGTSAHIPVGVPLLTTNASEGGRGRLLGVWGGASKLGDAAAPAIVGVLIVWAGWREIALGFGALGMAAAGALFVALGADWLETGPASATDDGGDRDARGADRRAYRYPMVALMGYFAAYNVVVQGVVTFTPTFIADVYGYSPALSGVRVAPESFADFVLSALLVAAAISRFVGGALADRYEHRVVLTGSLAVAAVALAGVATLALGPLALVALLAVFGAGLWGNSPARDSLISDMTPAEREGRTFSYLWTASRAFGAVAPAVVGFVADTAGIRRGFWYLAVATLVAAGFVSLLFSDRVYVAPGTAGE